MTDALEPAELLEVQGNKVARSPRPWGWESLVHFNSVLLLFLVLTGFSLYLMTKSIDVIASAKRISSCVCGTCAEITLFRMEV